MTGGPDLTIKQAYAGLTRLIDDYGNPSEYPTDGQENAFSVLVREGGPEALKALHHGIEFYDAFHALAISHYEKSYGQATDVLNALLDKTDPHYFRKAYIAYLKQRDEAGLITPLKRSAVEARRADPTKATIDMEALLGVQGVKLYELALREEVHSKAFREAVYLKSSSFHEGKRPAKRPVFYNGGPSGCGKSYSLKSLVKTVLLSMSASSEPAVPGRKQGLFVVASDGGVPRECSQIQQMTIKLANLKGYSGVRDIYKHSRSNLTSVKKYVLRATMKSKSLGIAIAETFSKWKVKSKKQKKEIKALASLPNTEVIFAEVTSKRKSMFMRVVEFMGIGRAYDRDPVVGYNDLHRANRKASKESKAYKAYVMKGTINAFQQGANGTKRALSWAKYKGFLTFAVYNDLMLVAPSEYTSAKHYTGDYHEKGVTKETAKVMMVSERMFRAWKIMREQGLSDGDSAEVKGETWTYKASLKAFMNEKTNQLSASPEVVLREIAHFKMRIQALKGMPSIDELSTLQQMYLQSHVESLSTLDVQDETSIHKAILSNKGMLSMLKGVEGAEVVRAKLKKIRKHLKNIIHCHQVLSGRSSADYESIVPNIPAHRKAIHVSGVNVDVLKKSDLIGWMKTHMKAKTTRVGGVVATVDEAETFAETDKTATEDEVMGYVRRIDSVNEKDADVVAKVPVLISADRESIQLLTHNAEVDGCNQTELPDHVRVKMAYEALDTWISNNGLPTPDNRLAIHGIDKKQKAFLYLAVKERAKQRGLQFDVDHSVRLYGFDKAQVVGRFKRSEYEVAFAKATRMERLELRDRADSLVMKQETGLAVV